MPLLLHIAFGNSHRLRRRSYLFEYAGVRFKLIQNDPRRWADVLLTIVPTHDAAAEQTAYSAAAEFLSALSWQNGSLTALQVAGGAGIGADQQLRDARCRVFAFPRVPFIGRIGGCSISPLPEVETEEQRTGLALFREARSSNTT